MPTARFKGILICSSEDDNFPASNLINNSNKKWKSEETGLDWVYVVLQLESPTRISGIDIGNEHSAFIEVSVGRTGWPIDRFKTILAASSFMTITESRVSENPNRVRCFSKLSLIPHVLDEKWDLIKVTCTQGFNRHVQFGLSFIKIHAPDPLPTQPSTSASASSSHPSNIVAASPKEKKNCDVALGLPVNNVFAKFRMRGDSSDSDKELEASSSLFSKWKQNKESTNNASSDPKLSSAAAIRDASSSTSKLEECTKINRKIETPKGQSRKSLESISKEAKKEGLNRYRPAILYDDDDENTSNPKLEKLIDQDKVRIEQERKQQLDKKKGKKDTTREKKSKQKLESSADKFKMFISDEMADKSTAQPEAANLNSRNGSSSCDEVLVTVTTKPSGKVNLTTTPKASRPKSPVSDSPPPWKVKTKRPSTSNEGSAHKRSRTSTSPKRQDPDDEIDEIDQILQGVVFVISGIQNPERSDMREKALKMGAKYKPDWNDSCTHLVCAFKNTPKYLQVQGHGIIVNRNWINDCYAQKKKLPWQDYQL